MASYIENRVDGLALALKHTGHFDDADYDEDPGSKTRRTYLKRAGETITIDEHWSNIVGISIDGIGTGSGASGTGSGLYVTGYVAVEDTAYATLLYPYKFSSYPSSIPDALVWCAPLIVCETENGTSCVVFPHRIDNAINGRFSTSDKSGVCLCTISIDKYGNKEVWDQYYKFNNNDSNVIQTAAVTTKNEVIQGVYVCLNRAYSTREEPFMTVVQNEPYLTVAYNSLLIKTSQQEG